MTTDVPNIPFDGNIPEVGYRILAEEVQPKGYSLKIEETKIENISNINENDLIVELVCSPINYADLLNARGYYGLEKPKFPLKMGFEGLFRVIAKGKQVKDIENGDYVLINKYNIGTWCTHMVISKNDVVKLPNFIDAITCSMIRVNIYTAYRLLHDFIDLSEGNIVVQNGANSHVGVNVIQIAKDLGYKCINIIRDDSEMKKNKKAFEIFGDCNILSIEDSSKVNIPSIIKPLETNYWFEKTKLKLGLNCIGDEYSQIVQDILSPDGIHVTYGALKNSRNVNQDIKNLIFKNIKFCGFSMNNWLSRHRSDVECIKMHEYLIKLIHGGTYYRHPFTCIPIHQVEEAIKHFHHNQNSPFHNRILLTRNTYFNQNALTLIKQIIK